MTDILLIIALLLLVVVLAVQLVLLRRREFGSTEAMQITIEAMRRSQEQALADVRQDIARCSDAVDSAARRIQDHVSTSLRDVAAALGTGSSGAPGQAATDVEPLRQAIEQGRASIEQTMQRLQEDLRSAVERAAASASPGPHRFTPVRREVNSPFRVDPPAS